MANDDITKLKLLSASWYNETYLFYLHLKKLGHFKSFFFYIFLYLIRLCLFISTTECKDIKMFDYQLPFSNFQVFTV